MLSLLILLVVAILIPFVQGLFIWIGLFQVYQSVKKKEHKLVLRYVLLTLILVSGFALYQNTLTQTFST